MDQDLITIFVCVKLLGYIALHHTSNFAFGNATPNFLTFGVWDKITVVPTVTRTVGLRAPTAPRPGFYKFLPANTADRLCQSWRSEHHP